MTTTASSHKTLNHEEIAKWMVALGSQDGMERQRARLALVAIGKPVLPYLLEALKDNHQQVRWEAAKALGSINEKDAAPALVEALMDESSEIRWLAAEALIALREQAVVPLLLALEKNFKSVWLRHGAHHVLHALERYDLLDEKTQQVVDALRSIEPTVTAPWAAHDALESLSRG